MSEIDLEAEKAASLARQESERLELLGRRIARKLYPCPKTDVYRRTSDAMASETLSWATAVQLEELRQVVVRELGEIERNRQLSRAQAGLIPSPVEEAVDPLDRRVRSIHRMPTAAATRLEEAGVPTVRELVTKTEAELLEIKYVSYAAMKAIGVYLSSHELALQEEDDDERREGEEDRRSYTVPPILGPTAKCRRLRIGGRRQNDPGRRVPEDLYVEEKKDIAERLGRSPDKADAVGIGVRAGPPPKDLEDGTERLRLEGSWGHLAINKDFVDGYAQVELVGELSPELADEIAAALLREKYLAQDR